MTEGSWSSALIGSQSKEQKIKEKEIQAVLNLYFLQDMLSNNFIEEILEIKKSFMLKMLPSANSNFLLNLVSISYGHMLLIIRNHRSSSLDRFSYEKEKD